MAKGPKRKTPWFVAGPKDPPYPVISQFGSRPEGKPLRARLVFDRPPPQGTVIAVSVVLPAPSERVDGVLQQDMRKRRQYGSTYTFDSQTREGE